MYVGYAVFYGVCYRFSTPEALRSFLSIYAEARQAYESEIGQYDFIRNGHDYIK